MATHAESRAPAAYRPCGWLAHVGPNRFGLCAQTGQKSKWFGMSPAAQGASAAKTRQVRLARLRPMRVPADNG